MIIILEDAKPIHGKSKASLIEKSKLIFFEDIPSLTFEQACLIAKALTHEYIFLEQSIDLQNHVFPTLLDSSLEEMKLFCEGFICSYVVDKDLYLRIKPEVVQHARDFELPELMRLTRALYNLEFDEESEIMKLSEESALYTIRNHWDELAVQEYFQIFLTFHMTRHGSRELYKLLEIGFLQRLEDFKEDLEYLRKISMILSTSGLAHPDSIVQLHKYIY